MIFINAVSKGLVDTKTIIIFCPNKEVGGYNIVLMEDKPKMADKKVA